MGRTLRILSGGLLWIAAAAALGRFTVFDRGRTGETVSLLWRYFTEEGMTFRVAFPGYALVEVGDQVRLAGTQRDVLGEVECLLDNAGKPIPDLYQWCTAVRVRIFDRHRVPVHADAKVELVRVPQTASWVVQTILTEENVPKLAREWNAAMLQHREEIFELVTPIVRDIILDVERHVEGELPAFVEAHRQELRALGEQVRRRFLDKEFAAFFKEAVWPVAEHRVRPLIAEISREIWDQLPLWGFSWRLVYQRLPFTSDDHVEKAWKKFMAERVVPILEAHSDDIVKVTRSVARDVASIEALSNRLRGAFEELVASKRFHALAQVFLREVFLDNARFQETMRRRWYSPQVRRAVEATASFLEPAVRRMGDIVLGTRREGITKEFAKVLRAQILLKDMQYIALQPGSPETALLEHDASLRASVRWDLKP